MPTTSLVQRPFRNFAIGSRIQCDSGNQAAPCPPTAPFASFAPCDCAQSCVGGEEEGALYLLRSCEACVSFGGNWMAGDDLISASCIRYSRQVPCHDNKTDDADEACFVVKMGFPYCSSLADSQLLLNHPGVTPQVYVMPFPHCIIVTLWPGTRRLGSAITAPPSAAASEWAQLGVWS